MGGSNSDTSAACLTPPPRPSNLTPARCGRNPADVHCRHCDSLHRAATVGPARFHHGRCCARRAHLLGADDNLARRAAAIRPFIAMFSERDGLGICACDPARFATATGGLRLLRLSRVAPILRPWSSMGRSDKAEAESEAERDAQTAKRKNLCCLHGSLFFKGNTPRAGQSLMESLVSIAARGRVGASPTYEKG